MIELILFREAFFYVAYAGVQCVLTYVVHLFVPDTSMSLARLACTAQFAWFVALLVFMFVAAGILGIDVDSIEAVNSASEETPDPAEKKAENEPWGAACDGVLLASTAVTGGVFIALLTGTVVCMHAGGADACAATSGGQYSLGVMCLLLVMQAQLLFSNAIISNIQRRDRAVSRCLVLGTLVCAYATAEAMLVLPSLHGGHWWLESDTAFVWRHIYIYGQIVYLLCCFVRFHNNPTLQASMFDKTLFLWLPAVVSLLLLPLLFWFIIFDAASAGLVVAPLVLVSMLYLSHMALDNEEHMYSAQKLE
jgi:hypothetical protein